MTKKKKAEEKKPPQPTAKNPKSPRTVYKRALYLCTANNAFNNVTAEESGTFGKGQIIDLGVILKNGTALFENLNLDCWEKFSGELPPPPQAPPQNPEDSEAGS